MNMRIISCATLLLLGTSGVARAQRAPQCASRVDLSDMVEQIFDVFVNDNAAALRASRGLVAQSASAPRGLLRDNAACVLLRDATRALFASRNQSIPRDADFAFFQLGDYTGVFVTPPVDPKGAVVSGTQALYVFRAEKDTGTGGGRKFTYVTELAF